VNYPAMGQVALRLPQASSVAAPGRILYETYNSLGLTAERRANRVAHRLGLGPLALVSRIGKFMGDGAIREAKLHEIRNQVAPKLKRDCLRLMEYALPYVL
jgi:hypothetical protein